MPLNEKMTHFGSWGPRFIKLLLRVIFSEYVGLLVVFVANIQLSYTNVFLRLTPADGSAMS